jgi:hypothetical protein
MLQEMLDNWVYNSPPWLSSSIFVLAGIVASGLVLVALTWLVSQQTRHLHNEFTLFTVTNIAVLYAVLLAFIAIVAWEDLLKASEAVGKEANLAEALYLDAQGLEDKRVVSELQTELHHYVETVTDREWPDQQAGNVSDAAEPDLRRIRTTLAAFKPQTSGDAIVTQEMLHVLNELFNAYHDRQEAAGGHIPSTVWWVICFLGVLIVALTAFLGMRSLWVHFMLLAGFATAIVIVVTLIVQLDYPFRGEISVSAEPFEHVLSELGLPLGPHPPASACGCTAVRQAKGEGEIESVPRPSHYRPAAEKEAADHADGGVRLGCESLGHTVLRIPRYGRHTLAVYKPRHLPQETPAEIIAGSVANRKLDRQAIRCCSARHSDTGTPSRSPKEKIAAPS